MNIEAILGVVVIVIGIVLFYLGSRKGNESTKLSTYVPVDTINSTPFGMPVVASGTVTADQPLTSPLTKKPCVYCEYILEKETETKDSNGNTSWEWKQVGPSQKQTIPFYLQDATGKALVKPENCEVNGIYKTQQFLEPGTIHNTLSNGLDMLADAFQFGSGTGEKGNRERITEYTILTGATLNAFGILTMEGNEKFFQTTKMYPLILSPLSKEQLVGSERKTAFLFYGLAIILMILGILLVLRI